MKQGAGAGGPRGDTRLGTLLLLEGGHDAFVSQVLRCLGCSPCYQGDGKRSSGEAQLRPNRASSPKGSLLPLAETAATTRRKGEVVTGGLCQALGGQGG